MIALSVSPYFLMINSDLKNRRPLILQIYILQEILFIQDAKLSNKKINGMTVEETEDYGLWSQEKLKDNLLQTVNNSPSS